MSSQETLVSDVYNQSDTTLCWLYSTVGVMHKFVMQTFNVYHPDKGFFEGRKGEEWTYFNDYYSMRDNICSGPEDIDMSSGNFRRRLLFIYLFGFCIFRTLTVNKLIKAYTAMSILKKRKYQDTEFIDMDSSGDVDRECFVNFAKVLRNTIFVKMICHKYLFIKNEACCKILCDIIGLYNSYILDNNVSPNIVRLNKDTVDEKEHHIVKALNQNVYFNIAFDYFKDTSCVTCASTVRKKKVIPTFFDEKVVDLHGVICVGYSKEHNSLIVKNSWGETWCQTGFALINSFHCINTRDMDIYIIDSNLPSYEYFSDSFKLFKKEDSTSTSTRSKTNMTHKRPVVVQSHVDLTSRYVRKSRLLKRLKNIPDYKAKKELLRKKQTVARTKKLCPAGYSVDKLDRTICNLKK